MLIKPPKENDKRSSIEISIGIDTAREIAAYLKKSGVETHGYFIERVCHLIFQNDKDWINYKRKKK